MDLERIEAPIELMHEDQVVELSYETGGDRVQLRLAREAMPDSPAPLEGVEGAHVLSPIVGTFYRAPEPRGSAVRPGRGSGGRGWR